MSKITVADLQQQLGIKQFQKSQVENKLQLPKDLSEDDVLDIEAELRMRSREIAELEKDIEELSAAEETEKNSKFWAADKKLIEQAIIDNHVGYLIPDNKLIYCKDLGKEQSNATFLYIDSTLKKPVRLFEKLCGDIRLKGAEEWRIVDLLSAMKRTYLTTTTSFNKSKWNEDLVYNQADIIMKYWIQPDIDDCENYNKDFDILLHCVAGGKKENIEHLEQWIAYKYCHPDCVANTPNLDIGGNPGGNGKGRYVKLCETVFTPTCVIEAAAKEISAGFNANWAQAIVIHYDEPEEDELPNSKIKNATGSESQRIEKKGIDAYMADRNHSFVFTSNNENGVVRLSGTRTGEDRRYSVIITNIVMVDYIMETENVDFETAKNRTNTIAQLVKDNKEVSKWLAHIIMKHNATQMSVLPPLHGIDYSNRFEDQKSILYRAFDAIYPVFVSQGMIPDELLLEIVQVLTDNSKYKIITVRRKFEDYLKNKKHTTKHADRIRVDYTFNGSSVESSARSRQQKGLIYLTTNGAVIPPEEFAYDLVSTKNVSFNQPLSSSTCKLAV